MDTVNLMFHFNLVHVKGTFHGLDRLLQCPRQPGDAPLEEEDFDFKNWIDTIYMVYYM